MDKFKGILASRKFWAAIVGLVFVLLKAYVPDFPVEEEQILQIVVVLASYIFGTAIEARLNGS